MPATGRRMRQLRWAGLGALALASSSCGTIGYLGHAALGEARILLSREPIPRALERDIWTAEQRARLELLLRVADAAEHDLGLQRTGQYREVSRLPEDFVVWVLTVAEPDRLEGIHWRFPIAGEVPYLGFFDRARAVRFAARHYPDKDIHLRTAAAFSTLGWLPEPVLPGLLRQPEHALVNTVVHELVHATLYFAGDSAWNESVASALGDAGTEWLLETWGRPELAEAQRRSRADRRQWGRLLEDFADELRAAYAATDEGTPRQARKAALFEQFRERVRGMDWNHPGWLNYAEQATNHAFVLANLVYLGRPELQDTWAAAAKQDFRGVVAEFRRRLAHDPESRWDPI